MSNQYISDKIVTAHEMARIEKQAILEGGSESEYMDRASLGVADVVCEYVAFHSLDRAVMILAGKGNNAGDAFTAGEILLERGFEVEALHIYSHDECSPLCQERLHRFLRAGGELVNIEEVYFPENGVLLDGLCGTGFSGEASGILAQVIEAANASGSHMIAIDIPSGLTGDTGEVGTVCISADLTIYLGLPKIGFFIRDGWDVVGEIVGVDFGLPEKYIDSARASGVLIYEESMGNFLPPIKRTAHKYVAGYLLAISGSPGMGGAAALLTKGAMRAGCGIVRLFHPEGMEGDIALMPPEVVRVRWDLNQFEPVLEEMKRAKAIVVGPGLGRLPRIEKMLHDLIPQIKISAVFDGDALFFIAKHPEWKLPMQTILTPHHGEMERLLDSEDAAEDPESFHVQCQQYVEIHLVTLVLKGAPTIIFHPHELPIFMPYGDPGMATAGSGDVLAGVIGALLSKGMKPREAAALGVYLHAMAGETGAAEKGSYSLIASDLIDHLPDAFAHLHL